MVETMDGWHWLQLDPLHFMATWANNFGQAIYRIGCSGFIVAASINGQWKWKIFGWVKFF